MPTSGTSSNDSTTNDIVANDSTIKYYTTVTSSKVNEGGASSSSPQEVGSKRKIFDTDLLEQVASGQQDVQHIVEFYKKSSDNYKNQFLSIKASFDTFKKDATTTAANLKIVNDAYHSATKEQVHSHINLINIKNEIIAANKVTAHKLKVGGESVNDIKDKLASIQTQYINTLNREVDSLKSEVKELNTSIETRDKEAHATSGDNLNNLQKIRRFTTELRYATEFGERLSQGTPICPVTRTTIMPKETVLMMYGAACECNSMVKYDQAAPLIAKFESEDQGGLMCLMCNSKIDFVNVTTAENAAVLFAWYKVESMTECDSLEDIYISRVDKTERDDADKAAQGIREIRTQLEGIRNITRSPM
jgi:hypothetical protein